MNHAKRFPLGERQFFEFAFALVGFRLAVGCAWHLIMRVEGAGGPLAHAVIGAARAKELHGAHRKQEEKEAVPERTEHDALPREKSSHRTMTHPLFAIPSAHARRAHAKSLTKLE